MYPIKIENLSFNFDEKKPVLAGIDLGLQGGFTGILGPNGSGKTTLIKLISRWYKTKTGKVLINDISVDTIPQKKLAQNMTVVEQESNWSTDITVRELVALGRLPHQSLFADESKEDVLAINAALEKTGVAALAKRQLSTLSGGEKQRARIAAALAQQTDILILDEPTTHLDIRHQVELLTLLKDLSDGGLTVVAVLHDLNLAALFCDYLVLLSKGQVFTTGSVQQVVVAEHIEAVYDCKAVVYPHPIYDLPQVALLK